MSYKNFERYIKDTFTSKEEAIDVDGIMAAVDASRNSTSRKPFFVLGLVFIFACSMSIYYLNNEPATSINLVESDSDISDNIIHNSTISHQKESAIDVIENEVEHLSVHNKAVETPSSNFQSKLNFNAIVESKSSNDNALKINDLTEISETKPSAFQHDYQYPTRIIHDNFDETDILNTKETINNVTFAKDQVIAYKSLNTKSIKHTLNSLINTPETQNILSLPNSVECPNFGSNPWMFEVGTILGVSDPIKRFSINPQELNPALTSRADNEKSLEGLDLEFFLSAKRMRWPVFVKSGIAYSRWTERMNLNRDFTEIDTVQGIVSATVSQTGDTLTYIYGDIYIEKDIQIRRRVHYYINRLNIPLSVVYEHEFGQNAIQAELGASFNIRTFSAGSIYSSEDTFTNVNLGNFFNSLTGVSYFSKLHYRRYFNEHVFLGGIAHFHYLPAEFSSQTSFSQKYLNYGVSIYSGYRF